MEKKASQFKRICRKFFYETIVKCTNLGTWLPGQFGRGGEGSAAVQAECRNSLSNCKKDAKIKAGFKIGVLRGVRGFEGLHGRSLSKITLVYVIQNAAILY